MRTWAFTIALSMALPIFAGEAKIRIDAVASLATIHEVIRQVQKIDKRPILSITQRKKESGSGELPLIDSLPADSYDTDSMIVETGVLSGPLDGGGSRYYFRRINGRWVMTKSESWVS